MKRKYLEDLGFEFESTKSGKGAMVKSVWDDKLKFISEEFDGNYEQSLEIIEFHVPDTPINKDELEFVLSAIDNIEENHPLKNETLNE